MSPLPPPDPAAAGPGAQPSPRDAEDLGRDITRHLASRLRAARRDRGLSLEALARLSGVSRSMVSQIERGESSPTVSTLWNLMRALQLDFSDMTGAPPIERSPIEEVIRADRTPTIDARGEGCRIRILSPPAMSGRHEVYDLSFVPGGALVSEPHWAGAREHLTVLSGVVTVTSDTVEVTAGEGDTIRYAADRPHAIRASRAGPARVLLVVVSPTRSA